MSHGVRGWLILWAVSLTMLVLVLDWDRGDAEIELTAACADEATTRVIRGMAEDAVDESFKRHVSQLYSTWMKEETPDQRQRIERGMDKAIRAYLLGRAAIEKWQPACGR